MGSTTNWRVTAKLDSPFTDKGGSIINSNLLLFRQSGSSEQWVTDHSEVTVFDGESTTDKSLYGGSWEEGKDL